MPIRLLVVALAIVLPLCVGSASPAGATILTFDVSGGVTDFQNIPQTYGDNVSASPDAAGHSYGVGAELFTPNVTLSYGSPGEDPALWTTGYGDLTNVHFNDADGDTTFTIDFIAEAAFNVRLHEFDLASFLTEGQTIQGFTVTDVGTGTPLFTQGSTFITGDTNAHNNFDIDVAANQLRLVIDLTGLGGVSDEIGIDNIRIGQERIVGSPVPEPSTLLLLGMGAAIILRRFRRRDGT